MQFVFQRKEAGSDAVVIQMTEEKTTELYRDSGKGAVLCIGIGKRSEMTRRGYFRFLRRIVREAQSRNLERIRVELKSLTFPKLRISPKELMELVGYHFEIAQFEFDRYRTENRGETKKIQTVFLIGNATKTLQSALERGQLIAQEVNQARILSNTPGGEMTPVLLAEAAVAAGRESRVKVTVLGPREMRSLKMGAILGVGQGSDNPPRFIIMEYRGAAKKAPVVLVGKGVTFDSGGINIKPTAGLDDMHLDMSGAAVVMHAIIAAAKLKLKKNIVALIPAVENMPSGASYRPGDILKSMSGRTIEIGNTDAEGRVIMADALTYAQKFKPKLIIDVATLTGAAEVALGQRACALFSNREHLLGL
ncbi:MAG: leucyl aminopeptidase family protein, partial [Patescibacteria group bacterium]